MPARHPHRLAHKCGMSIPQWPQRQTLAEACIEKGLPPPTPGQPNPFSASSVPSVAQHPSAIPHCINVFSKKQSQIQNGETTAPPHNYSSSIRNLPGRRSSLDALLPRPLGPFSNKQSQSTPFYIDSGAVPSEWNESRDLPFGWTNMKNKPNRKIDERRRRRIVTHLPSATSLGVGLPLMPCCLDPLAPFRINKANLTHDTIMAIMNWLIREHAVLHSSVSGECSGFWDVANGGGHIGMCMPFA